MCAGFITLALNPFSFDLRLPAQRARVFSGHIDGVTHSATFIPDISSMMIFFATTTSFYQRVNL